MPPTTTGRFVRHALLLALLCAHICQGIAALLQKELWLECSCMYASERNATSWGNIAINGSTLRGAKNDCYLIFIAGGNEELVALRFRTLQLAAGVVFLSHIIGINQSANINVCEIFMAMNLLDKRVPQLWEAIKQSLVRCSQRDHYLN